MTLPEHVAGSGNVVADLGHADPETAFAKAALAHRIASEIADLGLTQAAAADLLGIDQPKVSAIVRGRLRQLANRIGLDVTLTVSATPDGGPGRTRVVAGDVSGAA